MFSVYDCPRDQIKKMIKSNQQHKKLKNWFYIIWALYLNVTIWIISNYVILREQIKSSTLFLSQSLSQSIKFSFF